jgi:D-aminopeptidase
MTRLLASIATAMFVVATVAGQSKARARDLGIPFDGAPGPLNAITDVAGIEVGFTTLISGEGALKVGAGPVRTGVTAILPRGKSSRDQVFAGWFSQNGNGEMTGTTWIEEAGFLEGPVFITNTHSVGVVRDASIKWAVDHGATPQAWSLPVVAETWDGSLNDINGFHVKPEHVFAALDGARSGPVAEGNVGGGTGMRCYGFKCGTGTSSRKIDARVGGYTVGVLVQANHGTRDQLRVAGIPVGRDLPSPPPAPARDQAFDRDAVGELGSIIIVVATDAPLLPHQLKRLATRVSLGIGRQGGFGGNSSGDIFIAFSTANPRAWHNDGPVTDLKMLPNDRITPLFQATAQATEAAITNALLAAETMTGANDLRIYAMPVDRMLAAMKKYGRLP